MNWLEAMLAFALTMVALSTMVTAIMEVFHRFVRSREAGFQVMTQKLFDEVIWPRLGSRGSMGQDQARTEFIRALTRNPVATTSSGTANGKSRGKLLALIGTVWKGIANTFAPDRVAGMSAMEFMERFAGTQIGKTLATEAGDYVSTAINDLAQKFDRFGAGASQLFYHKARAISVGVSIVLAFAINVDAVRLFQSYLHDQPLRQRVIEKQEQFGEKMRDTNATLEKVKSDPKAKDAQSELDAIKKGLADVQTGIGDLRTLGVPIGHDYYPWCEGKKEKGGFKDSACKSQPTSFYEPLETSEGWSWFGSVLLAGLLIGLGAPFWFDLASGLSKSLGVLKSLGVGEKTKTEEKATLPEGADVPPRTPVEAFKTAAAAEAPSLGPRIPLSPTGESIGGANR
jgi:hypothetical protein